MMLGQDGHGPSYQKDSGEEHVGEDTDGPGVGHGVGGWGGVADLPGHGEGDVDHLGNHQREAHNNDYEV